MNKPRIDWLTLSWTHNYPSLEAQDKHIEFLRDIFCYEKFTEITQKNQIILNGEDVFICCRPFLIYLQFRASGFYKFENYYQKIKSLAILINGYFNRIETIPYLRSLLISRLDIARDRVGITPEFFKKIIDNPNHHCGFNFGQRIYSRKNIIETLYLTSSSWKARAYRKDIEIQKESNEHKLAWYHRNFALDEIVTRFELELHEAKNLKDLTFIFYSDMSEEILINHGLSQFYSKHRVREIKNSKQKDRWPEVEAWKSLFVSSNYTYSQNISDIKSGDIKLSDRQPELTKAVKSIVRSTAKLELVQADERIESYLVQARAEYEQNEIDRLRKLSLTKKYFIKLNELAENHAKPVVEARAGEASEQASMTEGQSDSDVSVSDDADEAA